jgi:hypothetical protein
MEAAMLTEHQRLEHEWEKLPASDKTRNLEQLKEVESRIRAVADNPKRPWSFFGS